MCELFVARAAAPFRLDELWPLAERLERWGIAGFGWGAAWSAGDGTLRWHRSTGSFCDDPAREVLGSVETTSLLVHLRRPSRLSTIGPADTQPFADPAGRFAFAHNGDLADVRAARDGYRKQGRIHGRADSEVGQRWLEDAWDAEPRPARLLPGLHGVFGGSANLAMLVPGGGAHLYAGNPENPVFAFRLGAIGIACTGAYSLDRSLFRLVAPDATRRRLVRLRSTASLTQDGGAARPPAATGVPTD